MKSKEDVLYIYLHVQKCAGSTFGEHIQRRLPRDHVISLYEGYQTFNIPNGAWEYVESREDVERYLLSLSEEQKKRIKVIYGRYLYYGIHTHFTQEARYVLFVREPASRVISNYNHFRRVSETAQDEASKTPSPTHKKRLEGIYEEMHEGGRPVSFDYWCCHRAQHNFITNHLIESGFIESKLHDVTRQDIQQALDKFYFVGLTEQFAQDAAFIFYKLHIAGPFTNENVSHTYFTPHNRHETAQRILSKNTLDTLVYTYAKEKNERFRRNHRLEFAIGTSAFLTRWWHSAHYLNLLYKISALLKRRSPVYTKLVGLLKGV